MKLQFRLMLLILPVLIAIVAIISTTTGLIFTKALKNQAHENAQLLSSSYAHQLDSTLKLYQNMSRDLGSASITAINIETTLQVFRQHYPQFIQIFYTTSSGKVLEMSPYNNQYFDCDFRNFDGWQRSINSNSISMSEPGEYFGEKSILFFAPGFFSYVKHKNPQFNGMTILVLPLKALFREIQGISVGQSGSIFVLDNKGIILHHVKEELVLLSILDHSKRIESLAPIVQAMKDQKSGFGTYSDNRGNKYISFSPIASLEWSLGINGSYGEIIDGINRITKILLFVIIIGTILAGVVLYFVVHSVVSPIEKLTIMAGNIEKGDFQQRYFLSITKRKKGSKDEISALIHAFNKMASRLNRMFLNFESEVDERKKVEVALNKAQIYLNSIVDSMPSMLIGLDINGKVTHWNKAAEEDTGVKAELAYGEALLDVLPDMAIEMDIISKCIESGQSIFKKKVPNKSENSLTYRDIIIYPLTGASFDGVVIRIDDVTEKVRMEELMVQSEKMLSVGGLAAGMAHEINNPLAGMMQTASVMDNRLNKRLTMAVNIETAEKLGISVDKIRAFMEERGILRMLASINESGQRVADIVDNMLSFSRKSEQEKSSHNLVALLDKTMKLASTDYDLKGHFDFREIEIIREYEDDLPLVLCEGSKIQQVLLNILGNGAHAMMDAQIPSPCFVLRIYFLKEESMVCIEVEDNGLGMNDDTLKRVFEPFFTTKAVGLGTGLGLSVSYFIITENHNGELSAKSEEGKGATFIVKLPVVDTRRHQTSLFN